MSDELLKSDSTLLIGTFQANSLHRRPEHPKGVPPATAGMGREATLLMTGRHYTMEPSTFTSGPRLWATSLARLAGISISNRRRL